MWILSLCEFLLLIAVTECQNNGLAEFAKSERKNVSIGGGFPASDTRPRCLSNVCLNGGTCYIIDGSFECSCVEGSAGTLCERSSQTNKPVSVCSETCPPAARCIHGACVCPSGTKLSQGQCVAALAGDPCVNVQCKNNGTCFIQNSANGISKVGCRCTSGYSGTRCEIATNSVVSNAANPCRGIICGNGQRCVSRGPISVCVPQDSVSVQPPRIAILPPNESPIAEEKSTAIPEVQQNRVCDGRPCLNAGICIATQVAPGYFCQCTPEWTGKRCETDVSECQARPCLNFGTCQEKPGGFTCICPDGFGGEFCQTSLSVCTSNPCEHGGFCVDQGNSSYRCNCPAEWTGTNCEKLFNACDSSPCHNNAGCSTLPPNPAFHCQCVAGWTGLTCEDSVDDCKGIRCPEIGQICVDMHLGYRCRCPVGMGGPGCTQKINECPATKSQSISCRHGGTCVIANNGRPTCFCPRGYTGHRCEEDVDECLLNPCEFGICQNRPGGYECFCRQGYIGLNCSRKLDACYSQPCLNQGTCLDVQDSFRCLCNPLFTGVLCETPMEICTPESNPCENNGTCVRNLIGVDCICKSGTTGRHCEVILSNDDSQSPTHSSRSPCNPNPCPSTLSCVQESNGGFQCLPPPPAFSLTTPAPKNPCDDDLCQNGGTCIPSGADYICQCHPAFRGRNCEQDIPDCQPNPCFNGGTCFERSQRINYETGRISGIFVLEKAAGYKCACPAGLGGPTCGEVQNSCVPDPCKNGGQCSTTSQGFQCICAPGYQGQLCDEDINECLQGPSGPCVNANRCINTNGLFKCDCMDGWSGERCDTQLLGCFNNPCPINSTCDPIVTDEGRHSYRCKCPDGLTGSDCTTSTVAGFRGDSTIAYIENPPPTEYTMSLQFRTTLPTVLLATGSDILGTSVYTLSMEDGRLTLRWGGDRMQISHPETSALNDGGWHKVNIEYKDSRAGLMAFDLQNNKVELIREWIEVQTKTLDVFNTKLGGTTFSRGPESPKNFAGCMRDIMVNGKSLIPKDHAKTSLNVDLHCIRKDPCNPSPCSENGKCVDRWNTYECICVRPYLPPQCSSSFPEATFGYEGNRSMAEVAMSNSEQQELELKTDVSMVIRTTSPNGAVMFLGSEANVNPQLDTFVSIEIYQGQLRTNMRLGSDRVQSYIGGPRVDDGKVHTLRLSRRENAVTGFVDDAQVFQGKLDHPFPHPLLATHFYVGGYPLPNLDISRRKKRQLPQKTKDAFVARPFGRERDVRLNPEAFNTARGFKGTIQDLRINGMHVKLYDLAPDPVTGITQPVDAREFGRVKLRNVMRGTVSDDTCQSAPCDNGAQCVVTFNDYRCECQVGWRGKNCSDTDFCANPSSCPTNAQCQNTPKGFICLTPATFDHSSSAQFLLQNSEFNQSLMFYTLSLKLRTRGTNGLILYGSRLNQDFIKIELDNGGIDLTYKLGALSAIVNDRNITGATLINDGQWHKIKLTLLTEQSYLNVDDSIEAVYLTGRPSEALSELFMAGEPLYLGKAADEVQRTNPQRFASGTTSFKGCMDELVLGDLPPLSFYDTSTYGRVEGAHFALGSIDNVKYGCHGDQQCGEQGIPCMNGAQCSDLWNKRTCTCIPGFQGDLCEINIDDCPGNSCDPSHGQCIDGVQNYTCQCQPGYTGTFCDIEVNECDSSPCLNGGSCQDLVNGFQCSCNANYTGDVCEILITIDCASNPCMNGAQCTDSFLPSGHKSFTCNCAPGYTNKTCDTEIDYCAPGPCTNGATCTSIVSIQDFQCLCPLGYTGKVCDTNIDDCASNPCRNNATCLDLLANVSCVCANGWDGALCDIDIDECILSNPCKSGSVCFNSPGNYTCQCPEFYYGQNCDLAGTCAAQPCGVNGRCVQTDPTRHTCECTLGYTGTSCETQIDYCAEQPCTNGATCQGYVGGFECFCAQGFTGQRCETNIDECASFPCENNAPCTDLTNAFQCDCTGTGFEGPTCSSDVDECTQQGKCVHGSCTNTHGGYQCTCRAGYLGARCAHADPCHVSKGNASASAHRCANGAACTNARIEGIEETVKYECDCKEGFAGELCQTVQRSLSGPSVGGVPLPYILGPILGLLLLICLIALIVFIVIARKKRATRGHYSPSRQEMTGSRVQMGAMMKPPPEERLI